MYTYAENDQNTGALLPEETDFLNASGAQTLFIPNDSHGASFDPVHQEIILNFIRDDFFTSTNELLADVEPIKLYPTLAQNSIKIESNLEGLLSIYDMTGNRIKQLDKSEILLQVDVSDLTNGQYVAVLHTHNEGVSTAKFQVWH